MDITKLAFYFGIILMIVGVLGFLPAVTPNHMLFGIFHVNTAHNLIHIISGLIALFASSRGHVASKQYFVIFGAIYGLVAVLGFFIGEGLLLGLISNNLADAWLHLIISLTSITIGYCCTGKHPRQTV